MFMMIKGTTGVFSIIMPTVANLAISFKSKGQEQGCVHNAWQEYSNLCCCPLLTDTFAVIWSTVIIHWLTSTPPDLECRPVIHTSSSYYTSSTVSRVPPSRQGQYVEMH